MKKWIAGLALVGVIGLSGCGLLQSDYESHWTLEKSRYNEANFGPTKLYEKAQKDPTMVHYSTETISEGKKMVFLAFGKDYENDKITVKEVQDKKDKTVIVLNVEKEKGQDKNPVMYIGVNKLRDTVEIVDNKDKTIFTIEKDKSVTEQQDKETKK